MTIDRIMIAEYYDKTLPFYKFFWHRNFGSHALHCGFWHHNTKTLHEALLNENRFLAEQVGVRTGQRILDAGSGIGGSAIWLAKHYGAHVVGIGLSKKELRNALALARANGVEPLAHFSLMDYVRTGFPDGSFDVIWAIESVCHAQNKDEFLKEAYRLLNEKGKLIIADGFLTEAPQDSIQEGILKDFTVGFALPNLVTDCGFENSAQQVGFKEIKQWDKTNEVRPSSQRMYMMCLLSYFILRLWNRFIAVDALLINSVLAGVAQYRAVKTGLCTYRVFYAEK